MTAAEALATIPAVLRSVALVAVGLGVAFTSVGSGVSFAAGPTPEAPPDTEPSNGDTSFERQLAEWSFGTFLALDVGVNPGTFTCTEPAGVDLGEPVTCFAIVGDERVIVATTTVSGLSGIFDFIVIGDYLVTDEPASTITNPLTTVTVSTSPTTPPVAPSTAQQPTTTFSSQDVTQANVAVLLQGDALNQIAQNEIPAMLNAADGSVIAVNAWRWTASSGIFTVDFTLNPVSNIEPDVAAWIAATNLSVHWGRGQAFREPAATIRPVLVIVVDGRRYVSSWELASQVADQSIGQDDWLVDARQP